VASNERQTPISHATIRGVERMMADRPAGGSLEEALEVFEVFASGSLADEVYVLDDVGGKRIAIAPAALKAKYRKE
jgi:hypothetical protein